MTDNMVVNFTVMWVPINTQIPKITLNKRWLYFKVQSAHYTTGCFTTQHYHHFTLEVHKNFCYYQWQNIQVYKGRKASYTVLFPRTFIKMHQLVQNMSGHIQVMRIFMPIFPLWQVALCYALSNISGLCNCKRINVWNRDTPIVHHA
jgi:hypothetical protein